MDKDVGELLLAQGVDEDLWTKIQQLESARKLVEEGKIKVEVYEELKKKVISGVEKKKKKVRGDKHKVSRLTQFASFFRSHQPEKKEAVEEDELPEEEAADTGRVAVQARGERPQREAGMEEAMVCALPTRARALPQTRGQEPRRLYYYQRESGSPQSPSRKTPSKTLQTRRRMNPLAMPVVCRSWTTLSSTSLSSRISTQSTASPARLRRQLSSGSRRSQRCSGPCIRRSPTGPQILNSWARLRELLSKSRSKYM